MLAQRNLGVSVTHRMKVVAALLKELSMHHTCVLSAIA